MAAAKKGDTIFRRRYMIPFLLSLAVAVSVQASGINSVLNYSVMIMDRAGFKEIWANWVLPGDGLPPRNQGQVTRGNRANVCEIATCVIIRV